MRSVRLISVYASTFVGDGRGAPASRDTVGVPTQPLPKGWDMTEIEELRDAMELLHKQSLLHTLLLRVLMAQSPGATGTIKALLDGELKRVLPAGWNSEDLQWAKDRLIALLPPHAR